MNVRDIRVNGLVKVIILIVTKMPECKWRDYTILFFLNRMVSVRDPKIGRWHIVTGVKFKGMGLS